ncbi:integrase, catalytic region, zinc finger, CCHC-type containing protein [Tanacetum coccineum]
MSTSNVHQQSLADAGSETRPPMLERGPYEFRIFTPSETDAPRAKKLEKSHDPLALVAHMGSSSRTSSPYYVTHPFSMVDYDDDYQGDTFQNNSDDPLISAMILLARAITQNFSNPTNNHRCTSSNTKNQAIIQGDRNDAGNIQRTLRTVSSGTVANVQCYNCRVILTDEKNDFLFADASRMEEIEELSPKICLMARIQPSNIDSDAGPSFDSVFLSEADGKAKRFEQESQSQFICDRDIIRDLEQQRDKLDLNVVELKKQTVELQKTQSILKLKMSENEDQYHDTILNLEAKVKKNVDTVLKIRNSLQGMFILGPKPMSFYDSKLKHGLGNVKQNTYAYADVRAQNQDLLLTISELKAKLKTVENGLSVTSSVRRPSNRDSSFKNSVVSNTKNSSKTVEVSDRTNKKPDVASKNVRLDTFVTNDEIKNALIAKNSLFTTPTTVKSTSKDTTPVVFKTRFSVRTVQSKSLDTTSLPVVLPKLRRTILPLSAKNKHMTGDRSLLKNFVEKFMGTVCFGNDHFVAIIGYGDYVQGNIMICHVYYVEGLGHNLFCVRQFCDSDLEVAFRLKTYYMRNLEGDDLLIGDRESNLYTISIPDMAASSPICLMSKASSTKSWLWHRRLLHLNFGTINDLTKHDLVDGLPKFKYVKDHLCSAYLCGPMRVASINENKYILVIVDDYSRFTWVYFLHSQDETPEILKKFIAQVQLNYDAKIHMIRTNNGTEFKIATLKDHYEKLGIMQQFSTARTPQQNGVVE